jgi:hypothetical protein
MQALKEVAVVENERDSNAGNDSNASNASNDSRDSRDSCAAAAIAVLGGHFETMRVGGRVSLQHTDLTATLLSLRCDTVSGLMFSTAAHVAVGRKKNRGSLKSINMSTEELVVLVSVHVMVMLSTCSHVD